VWPSGTSSKSLGLVLRIALIFDLQRFWLLEKACGQQLPHGKIKSPSDQDAMLKTKLSLHTPFKIFPFGSDSNEFMLYGTVAYTLKDGRKANVSPLLLFVILRPMMRSFISLEEIPEGLMMSRLSGPREQI
jgi:hypothetical protein